MLGIWIKIVDFLWLGIQAIKFIALMFWTDVEDLMRGTPDRGGVMTIYAFWWDPQQLQNQEQMHAEDTAREQRAKEEKEAREQKEIEDRIESVKNLDWSKATWTEWDSQETRQIKSLNDHKDYWMTLTESDSSDDMALSSDHDSPVTSKVLEALQNKELNSVDVYIPEVQGLTDEDAPAVKLTAEWPETKMQADVVDEDAIRRTEASPSS